MEQKYTSKNTSVNKTKLPLVYSKIDWSKLKGKKVLDYGAGKYTDHIREFLKSYKIKYFPFDPYNCSDKENNAALHANVDVIICSNVLNVILEDEIIHNIHKFIRLGNKPYFITVWKGDSP